MEVLKWRLLATGISDSVVGENTKGTAAAFQDLLKSAFPYVSQAKTTQDQELIEMMQREAKRGAITFSAQNSNPLRDAAVKRMQIDKETAHMLRYKRKVDLE